MDRKLFSNATSVTSVSFFDFQLNIDCETFPKYSIESLKAYSYICTTVPQTLACVITMHDKAHHFVPWHTVSLILQCQPHAQFKIPWEIRSRAMLISPANVTRLEAKSFSFIIICEMKVDPGLGSNY